jgi:outer membrane protein insertion porin family
VEIRGNRRIPRESVLYYVQSKPQDRFDLGLARRDLQSIIVQGEKQDFQIVRASQSKLRLAEDIRSSLGLEFRVQMPAINVPFRLIFAHNPGVEGGVDTERKNVIRFGVGRTF